MYEWEDGTPRSTNNDFHWNTGEPSIFVKDPFFSKSAINQLTATQTIAKARAENRDNTTLYGLSAKADKLVYQFKLQQAFNVHILTKEELDRTRAIRNSK